MDNLAFKQLPPQVQQVLPILDNLSNSQKSVLIHYLSQHQTHAMPPRKLGTLAHKASVSFADDWEITDEELFGE